MFRSDGSASVYNHWGASEPNDGAGAERCVDMQSGNGNWRDDVCTDEKYYVCKKLDGAPPKHPKPTPVVPGYCPAGFFR